MNKMILSFLIALSASTSFAVTRPYYCGPIAHNDSCDMDYCRVSIQTEVNGKDHFVVVGELLGTDGQPYFRSYVDVLDRAGQMVCVTPSENSGNKADVTVFPADAKIDEQPGDEIRIQKNDRTGQLEKILIRPVQYTPERNYIFEAQIVE